MSECQPFSALAVLDRAPSTLPLRWSALFAWSSAGLCSETSCTGENWQGSPTGNARRDAPGSPYDLMSREKERLGRTFSSGSSPSWRLQSAWARRCSSGTPARTQGIVSGSGFCSSGGGRSLSGASLALFSFFSKSSSWPRKLKLGEMVGRFSFTNLRTDTHVVRSDTDLRSVDNCTFLSHN